MRVVIFWATAKRAATSMFRCRGNAHPERAKVSRWLHKQFGSRSRFVFENASTAHALCGHTVGVQCREIEKKTNVPRRDAGRCALHANKFVHDMLATFLDWSHGT